MIRRARLALSPVVATRVQRAPRSATRVRWGEGSWARVGTVWSTTAWSGGAEDGGASVATKEGGASAERDSRSAPWSRLASNGHPGARLAFAGGEGDRSRAEAHAEVVQAVPERREAARSPSSSETESSLEPSLEGVVSPAARVAATSRRAAGDAAAEAGSCSSVVAGGATGSATAGRATWGGAGARLVGAWADSRASNT